MKLLSVKKIMLLFGLLSLIALPSVAGAQDNSENADLAVGAETKEVEAAKPAAEVAKGDEKAKEKESKWWAVTFGYQFSHNFNGDRPSMGNSFSIDPSATAPHGIRFALHLGFGVTSRYPSGNIGGSDITTNDVDMDPIVLNISKRFSIDPDVTGFAIGVSLGQLFPSTSITLREVHNWYYSLKPGVTLSMGKKGFSFRFSTSFQKNFHKYDYAKVFGTSGSAEYTAMNEWQIALKGVLTYSFWKMNVGVNGGWSTSWIYDRAAMETPKNGVSFGAHVGINPYDGLDFTLGITTAGPERLYGGFKSDYTLPLDPIFTTGYLSVSYSI